MDRGLVAAADVARLSLGAGFVFFGVVEQIGATTMEFVEPTKETAVVRVERVLRAPEDFGDRDGTKVTVRLAAPARKGERAVFFTVGWISGTGLAVQELGREPTQDLDTVREQMDEAERQEALAVLGRRLDEAVAVVLGKVKGIGPIGGEERAPDSEHDPMWRSAIVVVEKALKGDVKERVEIAFASSRDVMWFRAPKPTPGDEAILLLHQQQLEGLDRTMLTILEPLDMQPVKELERIQSVLGQR